MYRIQEGCTNLDIINDSTVMLPMGDFDKLDKHEKEAFHAMHEKMVAFLLQESNHFKMQFPGLRVEWRFQAEVYQSVLSSPSTVKYSNRVY